MKNWEKYIKQNIKFKKLYIRKCHFRFSFDKFRKGAVGEEDKIPLENLDNILDRNIKFIESG